MLYKIGVLIGIVAFIGVLKFFEVRAHKQKRDWNKRRKK
jgi:hypothetical protein